MTQATITSTLRPMFGTARNRRVQSARKFLAAAFK